MNWFWLTLANAVVPVTMFCFVYFLPESPVFLLSKGRIEKARKALKWFRGAISSDHIEPELQQFRRGIDEKKDRKLSAKELFSPSVIKPNVICLALMFFQQMSGSKHLTFTAIEPRINAVVFYNVKIFASAGTTIDPNLSSIIVGIVLLISITISAFLIDKAGRRILLIISDSGMAIGLLGIGIYFYIKEQNAIALGERIDYCNSFNETGAELQSESTPEGYTWMPLASLMLFVLSFNFGYGPVPWLYLGELLPSHVKGFGAGIATAFSWLMAFLVTKSYEDFVCNLAPYGCYWMFAIISILGTVFCFLFVPETKGMTLDQIQAGFK
ncbi:Facilitated trehalose transporter Tret1 [Folsomia candida]|uniref:Facilitated trehalose transporter Tret1 n=1 Tax=Folsomia candida TaxID=158441 RepID=A0A226F0L7_FOLCA|nr:Facilitated trehalose transporter Tret1 [Folsomia candida]